MNSVLRYMLFMIVGSLLLSSGCDKGGGDDGGGGGGGNTEANLVVTTNPAVGSVLAASVGPFPLSVTVTSAMPSGGVKIEVIGKKESDNSQYFTQTINSTTAATSNFSLTNTPLNTQCVVDIKVTSNSKPTNIWAGSYRYSRK